MSSFFLLAQSGSQIITDGDAIAAQYIAQWDQQWTYVFNGGIWDAIIFLGRCFALFRC